MDAYSMDIIWYKVWRDLAGNKARTALAVLSTAVGVLALGVVLSFSRVLDARLAASQRAAAPAHVTVWGGPFGPDAAEAVAREPGVAAVEGETIASFRWRQEGEAGWRTGDLVAREDYTAQRINLLRLLDGHWPDPYAPRALGVERMSALFFDLPPGATFLVEYGQHQRRVTIEGIVRAPIVLPPAWGGNATFYAMPGTAAWVTGSAFGEDFNRIHVRLDAYDRRAAEDAANRIEDRLEGLGLHVSGYEVSDPDKHWVQDIIDGVTVVLTAMGVLALGLSAFLIVNTINALLVQQVWQIGVMKAVGASLGRVVRVYLATALIYGVLALLLAVPLGVAGSRLLSIWLLDMLNVAPGPFRVVPLAIGVQVVVAVAVPLLAALAPVLGGAAITVREAIGSHGLGAASGARFGQGWLDRVIGRVHFLSGPMALGLRNAFRCKKRVALTLAALTLSGTMFTVVLSAGASLDNTIASSFSPGEDVAVELDRPHRIAHAVDIAQGVPGVRAAEVWHRQGAVWVLPGGREHALGLVGVPPDSAILNLNVVRGRSLRPGDDRALLFALRLADEEGIEVGDRVVLDIDGRKSTWGVVGLYLSVDDVSETLYLPLDALGRESGAWGRGAQVKVLAEANDAASQQQLIGALEDAFSTQHVEVVDAWSRSEQLADSQVSFGVLTSVLLAMVVLTAVVGGIGLASTMAMNVVERTREIGVLRAIGAPFQTIVWMVVTEGVLVGALSWLLAVPLSLPGARLFSDQIGRIILNMPLDRVYSAGGTALWLGIVVVLSALASLSPALRAGRISVREALAYE
jgi:putative ABC transport system permease protein